MNKFIHDFLDQVSERITAVIAKLVATHIEVKCAEHQAIVDAIAARDPEGAAKAIAAHFDGIRRRLEQG